MKTFALSCDEDTHRLIMSIPRGQRSIRIRDLIIQNAPNIEEMNDVYWQIEMEKELAKRRNEEEINRRIREQAEFERREKLRHLEVLRRDRELRERIRERNAIQEARHFFKRYACSRPLICI